MATTMDPIQLLYRNAALETELRLVKEQLTQAHNANQYLLGRLSSSALGLVSSSNNQFQGCLTEAQAGTNIFHAHEPLGPAHRPTRGRGHSDTTSTAHDSQQRKDSLVDLFSDATEQSDSDELIQFDEVASTASRHLPLQDPGDEAFVRKPVKKDSIGLGISNVSRYGTPAGDSSFNHSPNGGSIPAPGTVRIHQTDGTIIYLPTPPLEGILQWNGATTPHPRPLPFKDSVHNQLLGRACFLEDETEEERAEHWREYAKRDGRHTADEYEAYYSEVIRPIHLAKMRDREETPHNTTIEAVTCEERAESPVLSQSTDERHNDLHESLDVEFRADSMSPVVADSEVTDGSPNQPSQGDLGLESEAMASPPGEEMSMGMEVPKDNVTIQQSSESDVPNSPSMVSPIPGVNASLSSDGNQSCILTPSTLTEDRPALTPTASLDAAKNFRDELRNNAHANRPFPRDPRNGHLHSPRHLLNNQWQQYPTSTADLFAVAAKDDANSFRTVLISNIPPNITLIEVLSKVKGGKIFSAIMCETANMRTEPMMEMNIVLLTFVNGKRAEKFVIRHNKEEFLFYYSTEWEAMFKARVELLETTSRPIPAWALLGLREHNLSRVFFVHDQAEKWKLQDLEMQLVRGGAKKPLGMSFDEDVKGLMLFEFASLEEAKKAYDVVRREYWFFKGVESGFFADPCEGQVMGDGGESMLLQQGRDDATTEEGKADEIGCDE